MVVDTSHWDEVAALDEPGNEVCDVSISGCLAAISAAMPSRGRILDLGCGYGRLTFPFAVCHPRAFVVGLDSSPGMIARARASSPGTNNVGFLLGDGTDLPPLVLDGAFSVAVLQHLDDDTCQGYIRQLAVRLVIGAAFRFQIVDQGPQLALAESWCDAAGLTVETVDRGLLHEEWTWLTARHL